MLRLFVQAVFTTILVFFWTTDSPAELILTIDIYTADELTFSINGTLDADTIGESPGYIVLKNDWSNNIGIHTELFSSAPTITSNTILIGGMATSNFDFAQDGTQSWKDNIGIVNPFGGSSTPFLAGTVVTGSLTVTGVGIFDPVNSNNLELMSGFVEPSGPGLGYDWARFEARAAAVPEPSSLLLLGVSAGMAMLRRRKQTQMA